MRPFPLLPAGNNRKNRSRKTLTMNQFNRKLYTALLLAFSVAYLPVSHARMGGGGRGGGGMGGGGMGGGGGMMSIFDGFPTEAECRNCHEDLERFPQLEIVNPDRHHRLIGTPIPDPRQSKAPDAPGGTPGEPYECTSCHEFVWDDTQTTYTLKPFRDCLQCHPVYVITGNPMMGTNVHHQTETFLQRNCRACHGRGMGGR